MSQAQDAPTLGEVNRNMTGLRSDLHETSKELVAVQIAVGTLTDRTRRLEAIVYGALATGVASLVTTIVNASQ